LPERLLAKLRSKTAESEPSMTAESLARFLVQKGHLSAAQATNQMFHGLFQDTDRTAPVAAVVSQLWTTPNAPADGNGTSGQPARRGDMHNLFSDPGERS